MSDPCSRAASQYAAGDINRALSNINRCQKDLNAKLKKYKNHPEAKAQLSLSLARAYRFEGQIYFGEQNIGKAHSAFTSALSAIKNAENTGEIIGLQGHIKYSLGIIGLMRKQHRVAVDLLLGAKDDFFLADLGEQGLEVLFRLGSIHRDLGQQDKALQYFNEIQKNRKKANDKKNRRIYEGRAKLEEGKIVAKDDDRQAEKLFKKAKKLFEKVNFDEGSAQVLIELSKLHKQDPSKARDFLLEARDLGNVAGSAEIQGIALTQLGIQSLKTGEFEKGKNQLLKGLEYRTEAGDLIGTAQTLVELARITLITARNEEELQNAAKFGDQAVEIYTQEDHTYGLATSKELLGSINTKLGELDTAKQQLQEAKSIFAQFNDEAAEGRVLTQIGMIYDQEDRPEKAITVLGKAIQIFEKHNNVQGAAEAIQLLGLQYRVSDPEKSVKYLAQSRDIYAKIIGDNSDLQVILTKIDDAIASIKQQSF